MNAEIETLEKELYELKQKLSKARKEAEPEPVQDYSLFRGDGTACHLSDLFDGRQDLILVHNMGRSCVYCTLWADGFVSMYPHLRDRASFVLVSPEKPEEVARFAQDRGWVYPVAADPEHSFTRDMGFYGEDGAWPGVSAFYRDAAGQIFRTGKAVFGPGDDFCPEWHFFDLLKDGVNDWEPKYRYEV